MRLNSGQETGSISTAAFSFIVQEPRGIIEVVSERSRFSSRFRYRSISVSEWNRLKTGFVRNWLDRAKGGGKLLSASAASSLSVKAGRRSLLKTHRRSRTSLSEVVSSSE